MNFDQFRRFKYGYHTEHALRQALISNSKRIVVNASTRVLGLEKPGFISISINDAVDDDRSATSNAPLS